jgi:hypothetical protein
MPAINFDPRFAELVASGQKTQTIRQTQRCKPADRLQLYTGQRTKACRKLVTPDPVCEAVYKIFFTTKRLLINNIHSTWDNQNIFSDSAQLDAFAQKDGFADYADFLKFFSETYHTTKIVAFLITWRMAEAGE